MSLALWIERRHYREGELVRGTVDVLEEMPDARDLTAALHYAEWTRDYRGVGRVGASATLHTGPIGPGRRFEFELVLPPDALPSSARRTARCGGRPSYRSTARASTATPACPSRWCRTARRAGTQTRGA